MEGMTASIGESYGADQTINAGFGYGFATSQNPSWTLGQVIIATGGRLLSGSSTAVFRSVSTDTRTIKPGDLFLALVGENFDGTSFVEQAVKKGAAGVVVSKEFKTNLSIPVILVSDSMTALGNLAAYRRSMLKGLNVMAITGSSGKTTVKDITAEIMQNCGNVIKTTGNFNNLVGLPLSLLPANYHHDYAVLEMGMNAPGEIARLTEIADPDVACINNIQAAHLEGLGDINGVAQAKGELFAGCRSSTTLVVNQDDAMVRRLVKNVKTEKITFGRRKDAFVRATHVYKRGSAGMSFTLHIGSDKMRVRINQIGDHNVINSLAASALAYGAGAGLADIASGLEAYTPAENRLGQVTMQCGLRVVNDSYNANPSSMKAALATANDIKQEGKVVAVLGDMLELGDYSIEAHAQVGKHAALCKVDYLLCVGDFSEEIVKAAKKNNLTGQAHHYSSKADLEKSIETLWQKGQIMPNDLVLLKGSRGMRMEELLTLLKKLK